MKRLIALTCAALLAFLLLPLAGNSEGEDTVRLARVLYTLAADEEDSTMRMLGSVIMNRVDSPWFPASVRGVLSEPQQFPCGNRYDERSMDVARALMRGERDLPPDVVYYQAKDATAPYDPAFLAASSGGYAFYTACRN